ncbi:MAG: 3-phosphoshikimate 1-carboxyvinyltransferase [Verrucomicrobiales bacterium]
MPEIKVKRAKPIAAEIRVPGDRSLSHRAAIVAALSNGTCLLQNFLLSRETERTVEALRSLGIRLEEVPSDPDSPVPDAMLVGGKRGKFEAPTNPIKCGDSAPTLRLLTGLLAGQPFRTRLLVGDRLGRHSLTPYLAPLSEMGADFEADGEGQTPPLTLNAGKLHAADIDLKGAEPQVKEALLLAGLFADGKTVLRGAAGTRDHLERLLRHFSVKTVRGEGGSVATYGGQIPESRDLFIPGDAYSASHWVIAAAAQPGAVLSIRDVGLSPARTQLLDVFIRMGANLTDVIHEPDAPEPYGSIEIRGGTMRGIVIEGEEIGRLMEEFPLLCAAAALAAGRTVIRDANALRSLETDQISAVANNLRAMGVSVKEFYDGIEIEGEAGFNLRGARLPSFGNPRIAMAFAILGLYAEGETIIDGADSVEALYPRFDEHLKRFQTRDISEGVRLRAFNYIPTKEQFERKRRRPRPEPAREKEGAERPPKGAKKKRSGSVANARKNAGRDEVEPAAEGDAAATGSDAGSKTRRLTELVDKKAAAVLADLARRGAGVREKTSGLLDRLKQKTGAKSEQESGKSAGNVLSRLAEKGGRRKKQDKGKG